jgi:3-isopropylmalate/(R)-2-methylmalate dehydratase small subunit
VQTLLTRSASKPRYQLTVSLEDQMLHDDHGLSLPFSIDPFRRECLLEGLDDIGLSLKHSEALDRFEQNHDKEFWYAPRPAHA